MKTLAATAAAVVLFSSGSVLAEPTDHTVRVPARGDYRMSADEFRDYASTYHLSNGQSVEFSRQFRRYYVALGGGQSAEMFPLAQGVLMTAAGARIEFNGDGSAVTIRNYERLPMAVAPKAGNITLASR